MVCNKQETSKAKSNLHQYFLPMMLIAKNIELFLFSCNDFSDSFVCCVATMLYLEQGILPMINNMCTI